MNMNLHTIDPNFSMNSMKQFQNFINNGNDSLNLLSMQSNNLMGKNYLNNPIQDNLTVNKICNI